MKFDIIKTCTSPPPFTVAWYSLPLRLILGLGFFEHGYAKLDRGWESFADILQAIGMPFSKLLALTTIAVEIVGGAMILLGAFVRIAAIPTGIVLLVAVFAVHLPNGFSSIKLQSFDASGAHFGQPGYEVDLLYLAGLVALCIGGAGPLSVDGLLQRRLHGCKPTQLTT
jgi:putative oxidoreductase